MNKTTTSDEHMENTVTFPIYGVVILIVSPLVFVIPVCFISIAFYIRCSRLTKKKKRYTYFSSYNWVDIGQLGFNNGGGGRP